MKKILFYTLILFLACHSSMAQTGTLKAKVTFLVGEASQEDLFTKPFSQTGMKKSSLGKGTNVDILSVDTIENTLVRVRSGKKKGYIHRVSFSDPTVLYGFMPNFRKEYIDLIRKRELALGMSMNETALVFNVAPQDARKDNDKTTWSFGGFVGPCYAYFYKDYLYEYDVPVYGRKKYDAVYSLQLVNVERPQSIKEKFGEVKITNVQEEQQRKYSYEDDNISIIWYVGKKQFNFDLHNKGKYSIKLPWDDMAFVNLSHHSNRLIHSGIRYAEKSNGQPASVIPRNSTLSDIMIPSDNVVLVDNTWNEMDLFPRISCPQEWEDRKDEFLGKKVSVLFPVIIQDVVNEYMFEFEITGIEITEEK